MSKIRDSILISIHPQHVEKILRGDKKYEYRKVVPTQIAKMFIYVTSPVQAVVAVALIEKVVCDTPKVLWKQTKHNAGISFNYFSEYFSQKSRGYAIEMNNVVEFREPVNLRQICPDIVPPQSYQYMHDAHIEKLQHLLGVDFSDNEVFKLKAKANYEQ